MVTLLKALGWLTIAASIIAAFIAAGAQAELNRIAATRTPVAIIWILYAASGVVASMLWFALASIKDHLHDIEDRIWNMQQDAKQEMKRQAELSVNHRQGDTTT